MAHFPPPLRIAGAREQIAAQLRAAHRLLIVFDDDPTGTQTVHDVPVYARFTERDAADIVARPDPLVFISTNSRSLAPAQMRERLESLARIIAAANHSVHRPLLIASRSDSTLRGHYPGEPDALCAGFATPCDGHIIVPAFFEGGRYTFDDTHWLNIDGVLTPVHETEFARDPNFGFTSAHLPTWIAERTGGRVAARDVLSIPLTMLRTEGPTAVAELLSTCSHARPIVVNAIDYDDLNVFILGLIEAEKGGKQFIYRCAASFVKARAGIADRPLLTRADLAVGAGPGLIVAGSYVEKTTRQLARLQARPGVQTVEMRVAQMLEPTTRAAEIAAATTAVLESLDRGITPLLCTSRARHDVAAEAFLALGASVMEGLCAVVRGVAAHCAWVIAKGGITSIEIARSGLWVDRACVAGQIRPGVPAWRLGDSSLRPGLIYVVFPGNVGDDDTLAQVYDILSTGEQRHEHTARRQDGLHHPHQ